MRTLFIPTPLLVALAVLLFGFVAPAAAVQDAPPPDSVTPIEGISVRILGERLLAGGPYAISTRTGDELRADRSAAQLGDALRGLPGLQLQARHNPAVGDRIVIRGFGGRAQFGIRGLRLLVDGIPATLPDGQSSLDHLDPSTLERVELLRGPGAAFWGNAAGGVLAFRTRLPEPGAPTRVRLRSGAGSNGLVEGSIGVGGGLGERSVWQAEAGRLDQDGFRSTADGGTWGASSRWTATGRARTPLAGGALSIAVSGVDLEAENPGSLPIERLDDPSRPAWGFNVARRTRKTVTQGQVGLSWSTSTDGAAPTTVDGPEVAVWAIDREVFNPIPTSVIDLDRTVLGVRSGWSGGSGAWRWALSAEAERQGDDRRNFENQDGDPGALTLDQRETVTGLAGAAQARWRSGELELLAALRWDRTRFEAEDFFVSGGDPDDSGARVLTATSPSLGFRWTPGDRLSLFGSVGSFFETPTTTELANRPDGSGGFNPDLDPRRGWNGEVGVRTALRPSPGSELTAEVVAFGARVRDELVPFEVASQPGRTFYRNAGRSRSRGIETRIEWTVPESFETALSWTRVDARFAESDEDERGIAGNRIPGVAPTRVDLRVDTRLSALELGADLRHTSEIPVDDAGGPTAPAATTLDLRLGASWRTEKGTFSPWFTVRNVTDELYVSSVTVNAFGDRYFEPAPGRTFDLGVTVLLGGR